MDQAIKKETDMCFSADASFGASIVVGITGIIGIRKARSNPQRLFAAIPLVFAMQQLSEGVLWVAIKRADLAAWQHAAAYTFLVFAKVVWPTWVPLTITLLEKVPQRKRILSIFVGMGMLVSVCLTGTIVFFYSGVETTDYHLYYRFNLPDVVARNIWMIEILYFMATVVSSFISSVKRMKLLGTVFVVAYLFARIFYDDFIVSVWCFFAAILSMVVLWIVRELREGRG